MKKSITIVLLSMVFISMLVSACASPGGPVSTEIPKVITPEVTEEKPTQVSAPVEAALEQLASQLGVEATEIKVVSVSPAEWPNGCLGAPGLEEMCAEVITPGYGGFLEVNGVQYEFRSDESGSQIRIIPSAVGAAQQALAHKLGIESENIQMISFERKVWNNSCLGVVSPKIV